MVTLHKEQSIPEIPGRIADYAMINSLNQVITNLLFDQLN